MSLDLRPNRKYPNTPSITDDPASHRDALRSIDEALSIGQRRTSDVLSSFIRVSDLVDLGLITLTGDSFATTPSTYTPSPHTHTLAADITDEGALAYLNSVATANINANAVTNSRLATMTTTTVKGRALASGTGDPIDLTAAQIAAIINSVSDPITQYVKKAGDTMTGTLVTQILEPTTDDTYRLGSATKRYTVLYSSALQSVYGSGTVTRTGSGGMIGRLSQELGGTATLQADSSTFVSGWADAHYKNAKIAATNSGSFSAGCASSSNAGTADLNSSAPGSFVGGFCLTFDFVGGTTANSKIESSGTGGAFVWGQCAGLDDSKAQIVGSGPGSFTQGYAIGSFGGSGTALLTATGNGSFAQGFASGEKTISSSANGTFAQGFTAGGNITASAHGAFSQGYASAAAITASGEGSMAVGKATAAITASGANCQQFGPGVNATNDCMQIGIAGIRLKGTTGLFGAQQNGDVQMAGTGNAFVVIRSNGKNVQQNVGQAYTVATYTTDRAISNSATITTVELGDVLSSLIFDLQTAGILN